METTSRRRAFSLLAIVLAGLLTTLASADEKSDVIAVRLDTTPENGGKTPDATTQKLTKTGFEIGAIPLFKKAITARPGQAVKIQLPYAATGYAWEYSSGRPGKGDQGAVFLTGSPHGKVEEIQPAKGGGEQRERRGEERPLAGRPQLQVFDFQAKQRGATTLTFELRAVSDPLPKQFCSVTVNVE